MAEHSEWLPGISNPCTDGGLGVVVLKAENQTE
jgi:hypothetical protein